MGARSRLSGPSRVLGVAAALLLVATSASAFEALNGRVQAHGFFESQMRALSADYSEDWDVAQWYQVFNLELELDILPDGMGPIDLLSGFIRAEVRYDCVYSRGCGMFRSMNAYGDRSKSLPRRLSNARERTNYGTINNYAAINNLSGGIIRNWGAIGNDDNGTIDNDGESWPPVVVAEC